MQQTIVPQEALKKGDPQKILYHFPSIHPVKYIKMSRDYHFWKAVSLCESAAKMAGRVLVPGNCIHWERKARTYKDRRVSIYGKPYFILSLEEMTQAEKDKYELALAEGGGSASTFEEAEGPMLQ